MQMDSICCNSVISACAKGSGWWQATSLLTEFLQANLRGDVIAYNAAANGLSRGGEWALARRLLARLKERSLQPNLVTHNAVISAADTGFFEKTF